MHVRRGQWRWQTGEVEGKSRCIFCKQFVGSFAFEFYGKCWRVLSGRVTLALRVDNGGRLGSF